MNERLDSQARQYSDPKPETLLRQLNELGTSFRIAQRAISDRDRVIHEQFLSIQKRDKLIKKMQWRETVAKAKIVALYALLGGIAAKGAELGLLALLHNAFKWSSILNNL